jgi:hypothetical protein
LVLFSASENLKSEATRVIRGRKKRNTILI